MNSARSMVGVTRHPALHSLNTAPYQLHLARCPSRRSAHAARWERGATRLQRGSRSCDEHVASPSRPALSAAALLEPAQQSPTTWKKLIDFLHVRRVSSRAGYDAKHTDAATNEVCTASLPLGALLYRLYLPPEVGPSVRTLQDVVSEDGLISGGASSLSGQ